MIDDSLHSKAGCGINKLVMFHIHYQPKLVKKISPDDGCRQLSNYEYPSKYSSQSKIQRYRSLPYVVMGK